jgi:hypothetical protein
MTDEKKIPSALQPGETFHPLVDGMTFSTSTRGLGGGHVTRRGESYTVTNELIAATTNTLGESWINIIHDDEAQLAKWGAVRFAPGPWPAEKPTWTYGDREWAEAREVARLAAWNEPDPRERLDKLAEVERVYGRGAPTSYSKDYNPARTSAARRLADDLFAREQSGQRHHVKSS